jgi:type II secretory pathway component PulJ
MARGFAGAVGDVAADEQTIVLDMGEIAAQKRRRIAYRRSGERLERLVWADAAATPTVQALATHVRRWKVDRTDNLAHVEIELAIDRYTKHFARTYAFTTRVGGTFEPAG